MAKVIINDLAKSYGPVRVLEGFSLTIEDGEFVALVGPSGCGKSTILKLLAGLDTLDNGSILIGDREVTHEAPGDRDIAMVFQSYALYPHLSVQGNMEFGLRMHGVAKSERVRRVKETADILGLGPLLARYPAALSGGQRQRVALGRAMVRQPRAFFMDEPLSNLDAKLRVHMRAEISAMHKRVGVTTLYVTHDQTEAMTMADRIVVMHNGVVQQIASPQEMFDNPSNIFVAGFIGTPSMNFMRAKLTRNGDRFSAGVFGNDLPLPVATDAISEQVGEDVILGIRPEYFSPHENDLTALNIVPSLIERLGSEKLIHFPTHAQNPIHAPREILGADEGSPEIIARLSTEVDIVEGERFQLGVAPRHVFLFHPDTGQRIR